ncbi:hypothetical protein GPECTOR_294g795 [Gonium pectorale]|uniref:Uncharacterized protein n=1 Tax=Gonium pectorale TaxID=33097 RepID=A0A150FVV9_GONPE|nr:hypothetical protein GPECTOR_294g795 [Gonium pectorale]|eukprot:KXZ41754.1 hypothetical protein GPECTOR_294g795 [Gonium pectorale]
MLSIRRAQPTAERFPLSATGPGEAATAKLQPAMLEAVYGRSVIRAPGLSLEKLKGVQNTLTKLLGKTLTLPPTSNEKAFRQEIGKYVESSSKAGGLQAWPLVKVCRIQGRFKTLPRNAILVDLPGVRDSNEARAAVAERYLRRCDAVWVAAPITRAVSDKTAKELLDSSFRRRLVMEGQLDALTFICTKTDDIEASDTRRTLGDAGVCERAGVSPEALEELDAVLEAREAAEEAADAAVERLQRQLRSVKGRWTAAFKKADAACAALEDLPSGQRPEGFRELRRAVAPPPGLSRDEAGPRKRRRGGPRGGGGRAPSEGSGDEEGDGEGASESEQEEAQTASDEEAAESDMEDEGEEQGEGNSDGEGGGGSEGEEVSDEVEECSDADSASAEPSESEDDASADSEEDDGEDGPRAKGRGWRSRPRAGGKRKRPVSKRLAAKSPPQLMEELRREVDKIQQARSEHKVLQPQLKAARRDHQAASARFTAERRRLAAICARARNAFSSEQLRRDFHEGLAEVADQAGDSSRAEQYAAIQLPVFCISARDAQKLEGRCKRDGPVAAFNRLEDTEVPALRRHLRDAADAARLRAQRRLALGVLGFLNSAGGTLLSQRLDASHRAMHALQSAFECELAALRHRLGDVAAQLGAELRAELGRGLSPRLGLGAQLAAQGAVARARRWAAALHPSTYRATVAREGFHKSAALAITAASKNMPDFRDGVVDFNGQLASPILDAVSTCWDELWNRRLGQLLSDAERRGLAAVEAAVQGVRRRLLAELGARAEVQLAAIDSVHEEVKRHESRKLQLRAAEAAAEALDGARGLSADRHVERAVQLEMLPLYAEQRADRGRGVCHRNQVAMETFLAHRARGMLAGAAGVLERGAWELLAELQSRLRQALAELHRGASARFALLW